MAPYFPTTRKMRIDMTNSFNDFSATDIHILENGLRWIKEGQEKFANNFYHRLLEKPLAINLYLQSIGPWSFSRHLIRSLESIIRDLREHGEMVTPLKDLWPELSSSPMVPSEPSEMVTVAETFLDLLSRVAEDAWSPVLEYAWRKAIKAVLSAIERPGTAPFNSFARPQSTPHLFNKQAGSTRTQPPMGYVAPMMLLAGGIVALGLWMRCHLGEMGLKARKPFQFSVCS
jgi:hypothetical protein